MMFTIYNGNNGKQESNDKRKKKRKVTKPKKEINVTFDISNCRCSFNQLKSTSQSNNNNKVKSIYIFVCNRSGYTFSRDGGTGGDPRVFSFLSRHTMHGNQNVLHVYVGCGVAVGGRSTFDKP